MMYWINYNYIESAAMDGTQRTLLINTSIYRSCGLAVDSDGGRLYWYNDETIESMAVNGSDRTVFLRTPNTIPHSINILGDLLYYTDNRFIWSVDVSRPNTTRRQVGLASFSAIHHMSTYSRSQYEKGSHIVTACGLVNGTCKNIVFPTPAGIVRAFQEGYSFGISSTWSKAGNLMQDNFLIVTDSYRDILYQYDLVSRSVWRIPFSHQGYEMALSYDHTQSKIYWTSTGLGAITRTNLTGEDDGTFKNLRQHRSRGIAVDVYSRLMYYTDGDTIFAMKLSGGYPFPLVNNTEAYGTTLVLDPIRGMMYWPQWRYIGMAAMDGTQRRKVYVNNYPTSLTIDLQGKRLYWSTTTTLESAALDGSDRKQLMTKSDASIKAVAFLAGNLYYVDMHSRYIWETNPSDSNPAPRPVGPAIYGYISGIAAYSSQQHIHDAHPNGSCGIENGGCKEICLSTPQGPRCACWIAAKFVFGEACSVTNYCVNSPCRNGGTCVNRNDTFECICLPDLYKGKACKTAVRYNYYQYGPSQGDVKLKTDRGFSCDMSKKSCKSNFLRIPKIQIFDGRYTQAKIFTNGYVTFGLDFDRRNPVRLNQEMLSLTKRLKAKKRGMVMMAPLWTDNDATKGDVYYHIYDLAKAGSTSTDLARVQHAIAHAKKDILSSSGVSVTDVSWVMVVTWSKMMPRMYPSDRHDSPNTFQLVIAYDPLRYQTFMMYVYEKMGWDNKYLIRPSSLGYISYRTEENFLQLAPSNKSTAYNLHKKKGNTGRNGHYLFTVATGSQEVNYDQMCYNWMRNEWDRISTVRSYWRRTLTCPCDLRLAKADGRWKVNRKQYKLTGGQRKCIYERMPRGFSTQECCYTSSGSLISTFDGRGGQLFLYHPRWKKLHERSDVKPKKWCCQLSDNCKYFYRIRPLDRCLGYTPLSIGWFFGDPHIRTLDGFQYTFNGLGEYTLIETTYGNFTLQGRTAKAIDKNGAERDATIFSAFAAKDDDSDTIHVGMTVDKDGLVVFLNNEDMTDWFSSSDVNDDRDFTSILITKTNNTQLQVTFKSGFSLTIGVSAEQLDITVGAPDAFKNQTKGLMGVFNGDATDDLLPPGENARPLSNSSSEKTIFTDFGELWRIHGDVDSLFYYAPDESYSTFARTGFKPLFIEDVLKNMTAAKSAEATQTCGVNKECLFDFAVTDKAESAAATLETNAKNTEIAETLSNASPNITVEAVLNATLGVESNLTLSAFDPDGDDVTVTMDSGPRGATFDGDVFKWTPTNMESLNISFSASDGKGGVASVDVMVNLCDCSGHGECQFDQLADGYELKQPFRVVQCSCYKGWEGDYCEADYDGCQDNPCTEGTNCTDLTAAEEVSTGRQYNCSECPPGTKKDGDACYRKYS
ncbi:hypothetical protein NP493_66g06051 [Ridgeia piscesae]|uniref:Uncharacterized protein n=1 Tax=Ridgeia piscesae TaxID=27915 RepID=A0AAD9PA15_RIDPI|nr:hypothetical protein NP493_66g06051 [Ridgeia piscesae]